ncbi:MAG: VTT domain-containing protein [Lamprobacter sp.]|uniref:bifunctional DedA family/phosphatase PAP2 family protein n=1 Tax=Lamprobacter sp. TaxID=3100796 RepID=UPI002B25E8F9|nr:VTT domain-containing protein [Lamprobacter sp.]MEA3642153.1 VTT domain-containing protein [Lamprobacter sp.]
MESLFAQPLNWIGAHPGWAYLAVFLVAFAESVAVIGMAVPGVMILFAAGALIATGELAFWPTATLAIAGAISGDSLSYWIGARYRNQIRAHWPFNRHPKHLDLSIAFFEKYGAMSVAFGRFVGPGRAIIPMVAGMMRMPRTRFAAANISSAIAWGPAYLAPGIVFGASLKLAAEAATRLALLLIIVSALIWVAALTARRLFLLLSPQASHWVQTLLRWGNLHPLLARTAQALADRQHPDAATLTTLALALVAAAALLGISLSADLFGASQLRINQFALDLGQSLHTPLADQLMAGLSRLGEPVITIPLVVAILVYLRLSGQQRALEYWLAALAFTLLVAPTLGWLVRIPRPDLGLGLRWPWSFPSSQVLSATVLYGFLAISLSRPLTPRWRWTPYALAAALITAVALARLYVGAAWFTDIIASIALGLLWIAALGLAFRRHTEPPEQTLGLALVTLIAASTAFTAATLTQQQQDVERHQAIRVPISLTETQWRARRKLPTPSHREDLWHRNRRPFDIQYAGALDRLVQALAPQGWKPAEMLSWHNAIKLLSPSLPLAELPVIPHVHDGHHDDLTLVKDLSDGRRLVFRLWATRAQIGDSTPIWAGNITELTKETIVDLLVLPITIPVDAIGKEYWLPDLEQTPRLRMDMGMPILLAPRELGLLSRP